MNPPHNNASPAPAAIKPPVAAIYVAGLADAINKLAHDPKTGFCEAQRERASQFAECLAKFEYIDAAAVSLAWRDAWREVNEEQLKKGNYGSGIGDAVSAHTLSVIAFGTMPSEFAAAVRAIHGEGLSRQPSLGSGKKSL